MMNNNMEEVIWKRAILMPSPYSILREDTLFGDINLKLFVNDKYLLRNIKFLGKNHYIFQV